VKNLVRNIILFVCFVIFTSALALCQPPENPVNWQFSIKWEDVPLSEIPLQDTRIKILDGYTNMSFLFYKSDSSDEVLLSAEGNINEGRIYLQEWDKEISQINGNFIVKDKKLKVISLTGNLKDAPFSAQATIDLASPYLFDANVKAKGVILEEISSFLPFLKDYSMFKSPAEAQFNAKGVLPAGPIEIMAIFQEMALYSVLMNDMKISFVWQNNEIILKNFSANLDEGKISGEGEIIINQKSPREIQGIPGTKSPESLQDSGGDIKNQK
jgi:hypothetical protein